MQRFFSMLLFCFCVVNGFGQFKPPATDTAKEIIGKLNSAVFQQAEIILLNKGYDGGGPAALEISKVPYRELWLNDGFTAGSFKDCDLTLQNRSGLIKYAFLSNDNPVGYGSVNDFFADLYRQQKPSKLEIEIPLYGLSHKKGKLPHLLSNDTKKTDSYGKWGVQIKEKGGYSISVIATDSSGRSEKIAGYILTFVFGDETTSRQFDADFRRAISVCSMFYPKPPTPAVKLPPMVIVN